MAVHELKFTMDWRTRFLQTLDDLGASIGCIHQSPSHHLAEIFFRIPQYNSQMTRIRHDQSYTSSQSNQQNENQDHDAGSGDETRQEAQPKPYSLKSEPHSFYSQEYLTYQQPMKSVSTIINTISVNNGFITSRRKGNHNCSAKHVGAVCWHGESINHV